MLDINFQGNYSTGSKEETTIPLVPKKKSLKSFTMNRHGGYVDHMTWTVFPQPKEALYVILF